MAKKKKRNRRSNGRPSSTLTNGVAQASRQKRDEKIASSSHQHHGDHATVLPRPYPHPLVRDDDDVFLREDRRPDAFRTALRTCYEGFACDVPGDGDAADSLFPHERVRDALGRLHRAGLFRTDVTQPFGLGTRCAKTYVTRCLLGERGCTYKYLGLRMFAHPWRDDDDDGALSSAVSVVADLNAVLARRTEAHLRDLDRRRRGRAEWESVARRHRERETPTIRGRAGFDVALINRMEDAPDLKTEPMSSHHNKHDHNKNAPRCSVSWHADSCLEHYSTIAVYHTLVDENHNKRRRRRPLDPRRWSVALRVAPHAEGPTASSSAASSAAEDYGDDDAPPVAVSLPSGAAYYLLDDFNHHHQHAVLAETPKNDDDDDGGGPGGVRYSCTHRLLRRGHNVSFVLGRLRAARAGFHKKGPRVWRAEQSLFTETESEWLRQFFVQGDGHRRSLWRTWRAPVVELLRSWSALERRTKHTAQLLRLAAEERCGLLLVGTARKRRDRRRKALRALAALADRRDDTTVVSAAALLYEPFADALSERARVRRLWEERERDPVFRRVPPDHRPIPFPATWSTNDDHDHDHDDEERGYSPLSGHPDRLEALAEAVRRWGRCYDDGDATSLPPRELFAEALGETEGDEDDNALDDRSGTTAAAVVSERDAPAKPPTTTTTTSGRAKKRNRRKGKPRRQPRQQGDDGGPRKKKRRY